MYAQPTPGYPYSPTAPSQQEQNDPDIGDLVTAEEPTNERQKFSQSMSNTAEDGATGQKDDHQFQNQDLPRPENQVLAYPQQQQSTDFQFPTEGYPTGTTTTPEEAYPTGATTTPEGQTPNLTFGQHFVGQQQFMYPPQQETPNTQPEQATPSRFSILSVFSIVQLVFVSLNLLAAMASTGAYFAFDKLLHENGADEMRRNDDDDIHIPGFFVGKLLTSTNAAPFITYLNCSVIGLVFAIIGFIGTKKHPFLLATHLFFVPTILILLKETIPFLVYYALTKEYTAVHYGALFALPASCLYFLLIISTITTVLALVELSRNCFKNQM